MANDDATDHVGNVPGHLSTDSAAQGDLLCVTVQGGDVSLPVAPDSGRPDGASKGSTSYKVLAILGEAKWKFYFFDISLLEIST